jgi:hypothetical protein
MKERVGNRLRINLKLLNISISFNITIHVLILTFTGYGAQWDNIAQPATVDDNFSLLDAMLMLLGASGIYLLITWYVDGVFPGEYGVPLPWYFPVSVRINAIAFVVKS